jgi:hypothetical protein
MIISILVPPVNQHGLASCPPPPINNIILGVIALTELEIFIHSSLWPHQITLNGCPTDSCLQCPAIIKKATSYLGYTPFGT